MNRYARSSFATILMLLLFGMFLLLFVSSCEKIISVPVQPYTPSLSIECMLVPGEVPTLYLSHSTAYFSTQITPQDLFVSDASVTIKSGDRTDVLVPTMGRDSFLCQPTFFYRGRIVSQPGQSYTLTVTEGGQTYTARTTITQQQPTIDSVGYVPVFKDIYGEHEGVVVNFTDIAGQANAYRYEMRRQIDSTARKTESTYRSECNGANLFGVTEVGRAIYFDTGTGDGRANSVTVEPTFTHHRGSTGVIYLQAMDPASGRFYDQLDRQKLATSNPFIEPVFLTSNIPGCMGVFGHFVRSKPVPFVFPE